MDLLQQELNKNKSKNKERSRSKKIILSAIVICIVLLIFSIIGILLLKNEPVKRTLSLYSDGNNISISNNILISRNNTTYISLPKLCNIIGYNYTRGGYLEYTEDNTKCYLQSNEQIIGFEADTNRIFKTNVKSTTDYQYFELKNNIIMENDVLYIALEDLNVGCNVVYNYLADLNKIVIDTLDYTINSYETNLTKKDLKASVQNLKNKQAISYGLLVVTGTNGKMGIVDVDMNTIVGNRYSTIEFNEFSQNFIVSDEGKFGIISKNGEQVVELKYQSLEIINYSPLLYKVKKDNKYGVLNEEGNIIVNTQYEEIGANINGSRIVLIKNVNDSKNDGIVVRLNGKYGIIDIQTGNVIVNCNLDKIYYTDGTYYIEINNTRETLNEYINYINTTVVNLSNE